MAPYSPSVGRSFFLQPGLTLSLAAVAFACSSSSPEDSGAEFGSDATGGTLQGTGTGGSGSGGAPPVSSSGGVTGGSGANRPSENSGGSGATTSTGPSHVVIVAHQDDDLLFINPDLQRAIVAGDPLTTVYLTSGNAGEGMTYVEERERGIKSAYAFMANANNSWSCAAENYQTKSIQTCRLEGGEVQLIFYRLVDGFGDGEEPGSLKNLWRGNTAISLAVDGSGLSFTRSELVASLQSILSRNGASEIYTTDFSFEHRDNDHSDHENAAIFVLAASARHGKAHGLHSYITYSTKDFAPNLSGIDTSLVSDTFAHYASCDKFIDGCSGGLSCEASMCTTSSELYTSWFSRHYSSSRLDPSATAQLKSQHFEGSCLTSQGGSVALSACANAESWTWNEDYSLRASNGQCLTAPSGSSRNASLETCHGGDHQKWFIMDNGQVVLGAQPGPEETSFRLSQCLDGGTDIGSPAVVMDCGTDPALDWSF